MVVDTNQLPDASTTVSGDDTFHVSSYGGGIYIANGTLLGDYLMLLENNADQGGGLYIDPTSTVDIGQSWVVANTAADGGGVNVDGGDLTTTNLASVWNDATGDGGGILLIDADLTATNNTWGGDDAAFGGGLYASGSSSATVMNSIITDAATGEGVLVDGGASFTGTYNDVYGNSGGDYSGITDPTGSNGNISVTTGFSAWTNDGNYTNDNISLTSSSALIDAGAPAAIYDDADGSTNDIGALGGGLSTWDSGVPGLD